MKPYRMQLNDMRKTFQHVVTLVHIQHGVLKRVSAQAGELSWAHTLEMETRDLDGLLGQAKPLNLQ